MTFPEVEYDEIIKKKLEESFKRGQISAYQDVLEHWKMRAFTDDNIRAIVVWCEIRANRIAKTIK